MAPEKSGPPVHGIPGAGERFSFSPYRDRGDPSFARRVLYAAAAALLVAAAGTAIAHAPQVRSHTATASAMREVTTARGETATLSLADGSTVTLAPGSSLRIPTNFGSASREAMLDGEAVFSIRHDEKRSFRVRTRTTVTEDLGTQFVVRDYAEDSGTLVAVAEGDQVVASAAYFPALGEMLCAGAGHGCWWNGARSRVSSVAELSAATVLTTDERFAAAPAREAAWLRLARSAALSRSWGDCYGYLLVATGRAEAMLDRGLAPWDAAAVCLAVSEAGGVFTNWCGQLTAFGGSGVATNASLARQVRALLDEDDDASSGN